MARLVAALCSTVAAIDAARLGQDLRSRPGRAAALGHLSSLAALRRSPLLHCTPSGTRCSMVHAALCTDLRALLVLANEHHRKDMPHRDRDADSEVTINFSKDPSTKSISDTKLSQLAKAREVALYNRRTKMKS